MVSQCPRQSLDLNSTENLCKDQEFAVHRHFCSNLIVRVSRSYLSFLRSLKTITSNCKLTTYIHFSSDSDTLYILKTFQRLVSTFLNPNNSILNRQGFFKLLGRNMFCEILLRYSSCTWTCVRWPFQVAVSPTCNSQNRINFSVKECWE